MKDYLTTIEAAKLAGVTKVTIITWCCVYGIGIKIGGRWRVVPHKLNNTIKMNEMEYEKELKKILGEDYEYTKS